MYKLSQKIFATKKKPVRTVRTKKGLDGTNPDLLRTGPARQRDASGKLLTKLIISNYARAHIYIISTIL